jgi:addiction module HigA family antidote
MMGVMPMHNPAHPGLLIADVLENGNLTVGKSVTALAKHLGVPRGRLARVIHGRSAVSADMALLLQDALGVDAHLWLRLQMKRDLWVASRKRRRKVRSVVIPEQRKAA